MEVVALDGILVGCFIRQVHGSCTDGNYIQTADVTRTRYILSRVDVGSSLSCKREPAATIPSRNTGSYARNAHPGALTIVVDTLFSLG